MPGVAELIRYHRGRARMTQEELAERAGVSPTTVVRMEGGEIKRPRSVTLEKLAGALGVDSGDLRRGETRYVTDAEGRRTAVMIDVDEYERLMEALEDLRAADETLAAIERGEEDLLPFDEAVREMEGERRRLRGTDDIPPEPEE